MSFRPSRTNLILVLTCLAALAQGTSAQDLSGFVSAELRIFPESPAFADQDDVSLSPSVAFQPEYHYQWNDGADHFTFVPFLRLDADDDHRTHADLRELNWLHIDSDWDLRMGFSKVFWGVTESRHLVDIINQSDRVEDIDDEDKLGQLMINLNLLRSWGRLSFFVLPGFRERTFPDREAHLRGALPVDTDSAEYESSAERHHVDLALRWSHSMGDWDVGLSHFWGTSREPRFVPDIAAPGGPVLIPHYDIISQTSLDLQATKGSWLWKLEAMTRSGQGDRFGAMVGGFEYTFYGVAETNVDVGVLAEYLYDGRDEEAPPTPFDDDVFLGTRLALNDPQSSELLLGGIVDRHTSTTVFIAEGSRRLGDRWTAALEARLFHNVDPTDPLSGFARDDFITLRFSHFF